MSPHRIAKAGRATPIAAAQMEPMMMKIMSLVLANLNKDRNPTIFYSSSYSFSS